MLKIFLVIIMLVVITKVCILKALDFYFRELKKWGGHVGLLIDL